MQYPENPERKTEHEPPIPAARSFEILEGMRYTKIDGTVSVISKGDLNGDNKTFCSNNGVLKWIDEQGRVFVTPNATEDDIKKLQINGYQHVYSFAFFSNGELPVHPAHRRHFRELINSAEEVTDNERRILLACEKKAEERQLKPVEGEWILMDGALLIEGIRQAESSQIVRIPISTEVSRQDHVGLFLIHNGRLYFVNERGELRMGPASKKRADALWEANYRRCAVGDPILRYSDVDFEKESPEADPDTVPLQEQWDELKKKENGTADELHEEARRMYRRIQQFYGELETAMAHDDYPRFQAIKAEIEALGGTDAIRNKLRTAKEEKERLSFEGDFDHYTEHFYAHNGISLSVYWEDQHREYVVSFIRQDAQGPIILPNDTITCGVFPETAQKVFRFARAAAVRTAGTRQEVKKETIEYIMSNLDEEAKYGHSFDAF